MQERLLAEKLIGYDSSTPEGVRLCAGFVKGFNALTAACNACHQGIGRGFVVIQVPTVSPFSDQSFAPPKRPQ